MCRPLALGGGGCILNVWHHSDSLSQTLSAASELQLCQINMILFWTATVDYTQL